MIVFICIPVVLGAAAAAGGCKAAPSTESGRAPPRLCTAPTSSKSGSSMIDDG